MTEKAWGEAGVELRRLQENNWWKIAYWLLYGEDHNYTTFSQIADDLGFNATTVRRAVLIARRFQSVPLTVHSAKELPPFWNCEALTNKVLEPDERLNLARQSARLSQTAIKSLVKQYLQARSLPEAPQAPPAAFTAGLADDAPDDGLPIAPNGKARREREKKEQQEYDALQERIKALEGVNAELREQNEVLCLIKEAKVTATVQEAPAPDAPSVGLPFDDNAVLNDAARVNLNEVVEQQNARIRELEQEVAQVNGQLAFYCKIRPYLERIVACLAENEEIGDWLRTAAETLEEEKAFYEAEK